MSSKSSHHVHKHRKNDEYNSKRRRSRSRSSSPSLRRKERSHRTDKYPDKHDHERSREDEAVVQKKIKEEPADKGYRKYEYPWEAEQNARHDRKQQANRRAEARDNPDAQSSHHPAQNKQQSNRRAETRDNANAQGSHHPVRIKQEREREQNDERRREHRRQRGDANPFQQPAGDPDTGQGGNQGEDADGGAGPPAPKEGPNFGLSGALTEDTNTFRGIVIKYNEPPEARKPKLRWRLYVFKGEQEMPTLYIHRQSAYLLGRERRVADLPIDHPSCSKQHAAIQYRLVEYKRADGMAGKRVRPYIIDLESANGTFLNNKQIEPKRYYELQEKDVLKFGFSSREYVVLHEKTSTDELDDGDF